MSDKKSGGSAALGIIAVALAVMLVGVGYVGYERLRNEVAAGQAETDLAQPGAVLTEHVRRGGPPVLRRIDTSPVGFAVFDLPFEVQPLEFSLFWHRTHDEDPANRWLRQAVLALFPARIAT